MSHLLRFGRKRTLIWAMVITSIGGLIQSYSMDYTTLLVLEFIHASAAAVMYPATFVLSIEWAGIKDRAIVSAVAIMGYPIGVALSGLIAAYTRNFRIILRSTFGSGFIFIGLLLLSSESMRWLFVTGKEKRLRRVLERVEKFNGCKLSQKMDEVVSHRCGAVKNDKELSNDEKVNDCSLKDVFKSKLLMARLLISAFCWITGTYLTYGVSIVSVSLYGNKYVNFIAVGLGAIPASCILMFVLKYIGRRTCMSVGYLLASVAIVASRFVPEEYSAVGLFLFLVARISSSVAFNTVYVHTTEMWPTPVRHTLMALSSTLGRIGSIMAPLTPLLVILAE